MATDNLLCGMHHLNVTQIGSGYDGKSHRSHTSYEVDMAGSDTGIDYWKNLMPNTKWYCAGAWGNDKSGNTRFFWSVDANGNSKSVMCADNMLRVVTLALTHSNRNFIVGKTYGYHEVMYQEGKSGNASGNHIHVECCTGRVKAKVRNSKGYYVLPNMLPLNKVMFLLKGYTTIVNGGGLTWKYLDTATVQASATGEKVDQILHVGSHAKFASSMKVQKVDAKKGLVYVPDIGGWISAKPLTEVSAADGSLDQHLHVGSQVTIKGVFTVTDISTKGNCVKLKAYSGTTDNWIFDYWIKAKCLTEVA